MALANAAIGLSQAGNKVLVVDFDIEAPGLDTFDAFKPTGKPQGLVDYVLGYLDTGKAPIATEYIYEASGMNQESGPIWIMPSGRNKHYESKVNLIDWIDLYKNKEGYLLFEELKEQWRQKFNPDYVLIDSRTGHSDTSGICTRQLPDAVVILFFPNNQNLRGLTKIVRGIKDEKQKDDKKKIELHFVMSNVPDLDDEDKIISQKRAEFHKNLNIQRPIIKLHRYDSLSLLNQELFLETRPNSRLAKEYSKLVSEIKMYNPSDPEGAIQYINEYRFRPWDFDVQSNIEKRLSDIENKHQENGAVLFPLGEFYDFQGESEKAIDLFDNAIAKGFNKPEVYFARARLHERIGNKKKARKDLLSVLDMESVEWIKVRRALQHLYNLGDVNPSEIAELIAVESLDLNEKYSLANGFDRSTQQSKIAVYLYNQILESGNLPLEVSEDEIRHDLGLSLMAIGDCLEAKSNFEINLENTTDKHLIIPLFNIAMANWEASEIKRKKYFQKVIDQHNVGKHLKLLDGPNYYQCMAVAYSCIGENENAKKYLRKATEKFSGSGSDRVFSCWRYLMVNEKEFINDLDEIKSFINDPKSMKPKFLKSKSFFNS